MGVLLERARLEWRDYRRGLVASEEWPAFDALWERAEKHAAFLERGGKVDMMEVLAVMAIEQGAELRELKMRGPA